jgi:hypothetical protein
VARHVSCKLENTEYILRFVRKSDGKRRLERLSDTMLLKETLQKCSLNIPTLFDEFRMELSGTLLAKITGVIDQRRRK